MLATSLYYRHLRRTPPLLARLKPAQPEDFADVEQRRGSSPDKRSGDGMKTNERFALLVSRFLQRLMIALNPVNKFILAGRLHPLASGGLMLLNFRGRVSGRWFTTPVSYVRIGDDLLVPGGGGWWKNLASGPVRVRLQGAWRSVTPEVISEPAPLSELLGRMVGANRLVAVFLGIRIRSDGLPELASIERARQKGIVVVRLHLDSAKSVAGHGAA